MSRPSPSPDRLLDFARRLARELHGIEPPETELRQRIEYLLWGRKQGWTYLEDGLITETELRQLIIDHLDYECAHVSGHAWPEFDTSTRERFIAQLDELLYGRPARG